ncbi:pyridoxamine 5'-phosphate oxidase family protein [Robertkochia solimangrovi]|uniref:pyridoxamine 5'-phosphate oxidase family protein n=1 Tax=Robertkochia solimangrovi TaxID=2213046 RepID=UPI0011809BCB|nr:pyridoxamine 5'-phosphate oxidase family protein [Robertkochia solimangrovi]TRZ42606.1 flavin mononucleotide-binding protein [Robertkochia solimangrovi]
MITELKQVACIKLLKDNYVGHLGYIAMGRPYVVPITYYFHEDNYIICYSGEGHKISAMRKKPEVSLEVEEIQSINKWRAVLVHGIYEELHQIDAKNLLHIFAQGVEEIIEKQKHLHLHAISEFSSKIHQESISVVYRIKIVDITGKERDF